MKPGEGLARAVRLSRIQHCLHRNPGGLTSLELARLCGVCVRTIQRDLQALESDLEVPITQNGDRYGIMDGYVLPPVSFSLYEALVLVLASRLVLRQVDERNPHIESALAKLASVLPPGLSEQLNKNVQAIARKPANAEYVHIFEQLAIAWSTRRRIRIQYQSLSSQELHEWHVDPYFVEMTGTGYSAYVIGQARRGDQQGIRTFKIERIREAELCQDGFQVPEEMSLGGLLGASWGVVWGDETEVKLKFSPRVTRRVKESVWHPSQTVEDLPDGGCLLTVRVAGTLEITPWIRGWGPDVEVLGPPVLRQDLANCTAELAKIYGR